MVESETEIICCQDGFKLPKTLLHPECLAIDIPQNDFFYGRLGQRCMEFVRSMPAERPDCNLGPREQVQLVKSTHQYMQKASLEPEIDRKWAKTCPFVQLSVQGSEKSGS